MTENEIQQFIAENEWVFAKSMPRTPHEYCLRVRCTDSEMFEKFIVHIREHGYQQRFFKATYTYFNVDGHKYWTMGAPVEETILINRAVI